MKKLVLYLFVVVSINSFSSEYRDISEEHWAYKAIKNLSEKGVLSKRSSTFSGQKYITKYELVNYLSRAMKNIDKEKASSSDLLVLERLIQDFSNDLNDIGFDSEKQLKEINSLGKRLRTLERKIDRLEKEVIKLRNRRY